MINQVIGHLAPTRNRLGPSQNLKTLSISRSLSLNMGLMDLWLEAMPQGLIDLKAKHLVTINRRSEFVKLTF